MHVGLLLYGRLDTVSGGYLYDRQLVAGLTARGDQVTIISLPWRGFYRHLGDNFSYGLFLRLRQLALDYLIQDELAHPSLIWLNRQLRRQVSYPLISLVHLLRSSEPWPGWGRRWHGWLERRYFAAVDGIIGNSRATLALTRRLAPAATPHLLAYPGGDHLVEMPERRPWNDPEQDTSPLRLLYVGNLIRRKGLHTLLEALSQLPRDHWRLTVIGRDDMEPDYVRRIQRQILALGLTEVIRLLGAVEPASVSQFYASHQLFVLPSLYEPLGIVYLEAMGHGLPVIGSSAGGGAELITHGDNGLLIGPGDAPALAGHLARLIADRHELDRLSVGAWRHAREHPTWMETTDRIRGFAAGLVGAAAVQRGR